MLADAAVSVLVIIGLILAGAAQPMRGAQHNHTLLSRIPGLSHVTVQVQQTT